MSLDDTGVYSETRSHRGRRCPGVAIVKVEPLQGLPKGLHVQVQDTLGEFESGCVEPQLPFRRRPLLSRPPVWIPSLPHSPSGSPSPTNPSSPLLPVLSSDAHLGPTLSDSGQSNANITRGFLWSGYLYQTSLPAYRPHLTPLCADAVGGEFSPYPCPVLAPCPYTPLLCK